jgi:hypothetical protein
VVSDGRERYGGAHLRRECVTSSDFLEGFDSERRVVSHIHVKGWGGIGNCPCLFSAFVIGGDGGRSTLLQR